MYNSYGDNNKFIYNNQYNNNNIFQIKKSRPENLMDSKKIENTLSLAGLDINYFEIMQQNSYQILKNKGY